MLPQGDDFASIDDVAKCDPPARQRCRPHVLTAATRPLADASVPSSREGAKSRHQLASRPG